MGLPRTLTLHESALTNGEYTSYTGLWDELIEPGEDVLGVREVRGWMKGRFTSVDPSIVDHILRLFHPNLGAADTLNQGQFFSVLRLLTHIMGNPGKAVNGGLVFVQPTDPSPLSVSTPRGEVPNSVPAGSPVTNTYNSSNPNNPFASRYPNTMNNDIPSASPSKPSTSVKHALSSRPVSNPPPSRSNPIVPSTRNGNIPPSPGRPFSNSVSNSALSSDEGSVPDYVPTTIRAASSPNPPIPNPFLFRANSIPRSIVPPVPTTLVPAASNSTVPSSGMQEVTKVVPPALPPRKPSFLPPPRHASQQPSVASASSTKSNLTPPIKPPKPSHFQSSIASVSSPFNTLKTSPNPTSKKEPNPPTTSSLPGHNISPLIKQGLLAAKGAQLSAERGLDKLRTWEIIKTSSGMPSPAMKERNTSTDRERAGSVSSEGRNGRIQSTTRHVQSVPGRDWEHSRSPPLPPGAYPKSVDENEEEDEGPFIGPTSPLDLTSSTSASGTSYGHAQIREEDDVFASPVSPTFTGPRVTRSKSLHSGGTPPVPPPRRKRPESVQIGPSTPTAEERNSWIPGSYMVDDGPFGDDSESASSRRPPPRARASIGYGLGAAELMTPTQNNPVGRELHGLSGSSTVANLRNQFHSLSMKTKPGLESARAKVEGKLIPGGYGKWGSEGLTSGDGLGPFRRGKLRKTMGGVDGIATGRRGSEGSEEDAGELDEDTEAEEVRRNGWRPLKG